MPRHVCDAALPHAAEAARPCSRHPLVMPASLPSSFWPAQEDVVHSYVVEGPGGRITDLLSFYTLPSSVIGNDQYNSLKVGGRLAVLPWASTAAGWAVEEHGNCWLWFGVEIAGSVPAWRRFSLFVLPLVGRLHVLHGAGCHAAAAAHERCTHPGPLHGWVQQWVEQWGWWCMHVPTALRVHACGAPLQCLSSVALRPVLPVVGRTTLNLAISCALHSGHDVFNALDIFENEKILKGEPGRQLLCCMSRGQAGAGCTRCFSRAGGCTLPHTPRPNLELCTVLEHPLQSSSLASATASCGTTCSTGGWRRTSPPTKWGWSCSRAPGRAARADWCIETHALCSSPPGNPAGDRPCPLANHCYAALPFLLPLAGLARLSPLCALPCCLCFAAPKTLFIAPLELSSNLI